jgi:hypothetical protein
MQLLVCAWLLVLGVAVFAAWSRWRRIARESGWLPAELVGARLAYAERSFLSRRPWLIARVDRGYRKEGVIWLTELKTRKQHLPYLSDVVELSAQKVAVEAETGFAVSGTGYVLTQLPDRLRRLHRVELLHKTEIESLIRRRAEILAGALAPRYARDRASCAACMYRAECENARNRAAQG